jgi:hypothetical protein
MKTIVDGTEDARFSHSIENECTLMAYRLSNLLFAISDGGVNFLEAQSVGLQVPDSPLCLRLPPFMINKRHA